MTLTSIAKLVGVHPSTVSRALRKDARPTETNRRIRELASLHGFSPDSVAASLRTRRTGTIGVLVHRLTDVVQALLFEAIERTLLENGYQAIVVNTYDDPTEQRRRVNLLRSRRVDGLIVADAHTDGRYVEWIASTGTPFVLVNRGVGDYPSVTVDDYAGGRLVGTHLADKGHERIAILAGIQHSPASAGRLSGCRDALLERGIHVPGDAIEHTALDASTGRSGLKRLLQRYPSTSAVFAVNDFDALGAVIELRALGLEPGVDVAVVGFNDIDVAAAAQLTTVRSPHTRMGTQASLMLLDVINGRPVTSIRLEPELIVRATSGA